MTFQELLTEIKTMKTWEIKSKLRHLNAECAKGNKDEKTTATVLTLSHVLNERAIEEMYNEAFCITTKSAQSWTHGQ